MSRGIYEWALPASVGVHLAIAGFFFVTHRGSAPAEEPDPAPAYAGETFELPAPNTVDQPLANASPSPEEQGNAAPAESPDAPARPQAHAGRQTTRPSNAGRPSAGRASEGSSDDVGTASAALTYGAVGDRSASDLLTSFTHGFAQGASGDPAWRTVPLGSAGDATLTITLSDDGHVEGTSLAGNASPALSAGVKRTMALIGGRPFVARGKVTKLQLSATVSSDAVHDNSGSDVFAVGRSVAGGEGHGWFAFAIGRKIDLRVRLQQ